MVGAALGWMIMFRIRISSTAFLQVFCLFRC